MRCFRLLLSVMFITACLTSCSQNMADSERELTTSMEQRRAAFQRGDADGYSKLSADYLVLVDDDGAHRTKTSVLEQIRRNGPSPTLVKIDELKVQTNGDIGIITYHVSKEEKFGSQSLKSEDRELEVYKRQEGKWMLISRAIVPLPYPNRIPATVDATVYNHYVGVYDFGDRFLVTVVRDGDKLSVYNTEDKTPQGLLPFSEVSFYQDKSTGVSTFVRDKKGNVVALEIWDGNSTVTGRKIS
jgi:ketosteroid isomerase-like protein